MRHIKCTELYISGKLIILLTNSVKKSFLRNFGYKCLTSSFRYLGQKKYSELLELLYNGATLLLQHEQVCNTFFIVVINIKRFIFSK